MARRAPSSPAAPARPGVCSPCAHARSMPRLGQPGCVRPKRRTPPSTVRAGIEGTLSQAVRTLHLRRARYIGLAKVHLQHVLTAAALNLARVAAWLAGTPLARTRHSAFVRLMALPA